jgi:hypothetical protein
MGLEIELEITHAELADLWRNHEALGIERIAYDEKDDSDPADVEVDGDSEDTDWAEPAADWMDEKKAAVRRVVACLVNDPESLPQIGRRVERIVRQVGSADIYFDDGSFVSATVSDPQPATHEQQAVVDEIYRTAQPNVDMVAAVDRRDLLGARDARKHGAKSPRFWAQLVEGPFELFMLRDVPMNLARPLNDFPTRVSRLRNPRQAWDVARKHAEPRSFARLVRPR